MDRPNYFLADLPAEASFTAAMVAEACQTLRRNRERYLANRSTTSLARLISTVAENWLHPDYPVRRLALREGPAATGFSEAVLAKGLDGFFGQLNQDTLRGLLVRELGHPQRLDEWGFTSQEEQFGQTAIASGPDFLVQIVTDSLPAASLMGMVVGLLVRSAQFIRCDGGCSLFARLFAHSIYDAEPKVASCLEVAEWQAGSTALDEALFRETGYVTATGPDERLDDIRSRLPSQVRFLGCGGGVSFGFVANDGLSRFAARKIVAGAADDVVLWDQQSGWSPHAFYVETGGSVSPELFAEMLAEELGRREVTEPCGRRHSQVEATIISRRDFYQVRAANSAETRLWASKDSTAWTVVFEADPQFQCSCLHRFVYVKAAAGLDEVLRNAETARGKVSTVGVAAGAERRQDIVRQLARWGAKRVCPIGRMQHPLPACRQVGWPSLSELVTWTHWET